MPAEKDKFVQPLRLNRGEEKFHKVGDYRWLILRPNKDKSGKLPEDFLLTGLDYFTSVCESGEHWLLTIIASDKVTNEWKGNYAKCSFGSYVNKQWKDDEEKTATFLSQLKENRYLAAIECTSVIPLEVAAKVIADKKILFKFDAPLFNLKDFEGWTDSKKNELTSAFKWYVEGLIDKGEVEEDTPEYKLVDAALMTGTVALGTSQISNKYYLPIEGYPKSPGKGDPKWEKIEFTIPGKEQEKGKGGWTTGGGQSEIDKLNERLTFIKEKAGELRDVLLQYGIHPTNDNLLPFALSLTTGSLFTPSKSGEIVNLPVVKQEKVEDVATEGELVEIKSLLEYFEEEKLTQWYNDLIAKGSVDPEIKPLEVLKNLRTITDSKVYKEEPKSVSAWVKRYLKVSSGNLLELSYKDLSLLVKVVERTEEEQKKNASYTIMLVDDMTPKF